MKRFALMQVFLAFLLAASAAAKPAPQARITFGLHAQIGGSACNTVAPGSPNWTGTQHGVCLTWNASTSVVTGYKLYRGTLTGGPYVLLNSTVTANLFFEDATAAVSTTYFYVTTAVDANGDESAYSNQVSVTTPTTFQTNPFPPPNFAGKVQ